MLVNSAADLGEGPGDPFPPLFWVKTEKSQKEEKRAGQGNEESTPRVDSSGPLTHHDARDLGLIWLVKKRKILFWILLDLRIQSWSF